MKAKQKMESMSLMYYFDSLFFPYVFLIYCFILFCSSLRRDLLLMLRQSGDKKDLNKRGRGTMMLEIMYFSLS
jgi:hypothetical protein